MSLIPNDEDRARQAGFMQGAAMAEAENARLRADNERLREEVKSLRAEVVGLHETSNAIHKDRDRLRGALQRCADYLDASASCNSDRAMASMARAALAGTTDQPSAAGCAVVGDGYCTTHKQDAMMCDPFLRSLNWKEVTPGDDTPDNQPAGGGK